MFSFRDFDLPLNKELLCPLQIVKFIVINLFLDIFNIFNFLIFFVLFFYFFLGIYFKIKFLETSLKTYRFHFFFISFYKNFIFLIYESFELFF